MYDTQKRYLLTLLFIFFIYTVDQVRSNVLQREGGVRNKNNDVIPMEPELNCPIDRRNETAGFIYSPNYPNNYTEDCNCTYIIDVSSEFKQVLTGIR